MSDSEIIQRGFNVNNNVSKNNAIFVLEDDLSIQLLARFDNIKNLKWVVATEI